MAEETLIKQPEPNGTGPVAVSPGSGFKEIGRPGLKTWGGRLYEEFLRDLQGDKAVKVYKEMADNSAVIGAMLFAIKMLARQADKRVEPADDTPEAARAADLVDTALDDMSASFEDTLVEILSSLQYGWSYHEQVYKYRRGPAATPGESSAYTDGLIGWRKWSIRGQDTLYRWEWDDEGGLAGMTQTAPPKYEPVTIPIGRALLFRPEAHKNSPEGRSILRTSYVSFHYCKRMEELEASGTARDLSGYPVAKIPGSVIKAAGADFTNWQKFVTEIQRHEQEGAVIPSDRDSNGNPLYELTLLASPSRRTLDLDKIIGRYNRLMAMSVMADFLFLGQQQVGSFALADTKTSLFSAALGAWLQSIAAVINRHAIPRLLQVNNLPLQVAPRLVFGDLDQPNMQVYGQFFQAMANAGFDLAGDPELEQWVRRIFNMPEMSEDQQKMRAQADATTDSASQGLAADHFQQVADGATP